MNNDAQQQIDGPVVLDKMGVDMGALLDEFRLSTSYVEQYTRDFPSLDNLVDGVAINAQVDNVMVGDTTMAGLVRSIPRESLQQLPVFSAVVNGTKISIPAYICTYLLKKTAFNEDTFGKGLLSTLQIGAEQALTHGYAPFMSASGSMYNQFGTTMKLLHYSDTSPEPGITDANESGYHYVVANLTPSAVDRIIKQAEGNPNTKWNVPALKALRANTPRAKDYTIYESQPKQNSAGAQMGPTYQFVTRYPSGAPEDTIVTFSPEIGEAPLRVMDSRSKFGYPRVQYLVIDPAALTPFGLSRVRLASPNQNLMNIYYGQIASMLLLNSKPPIFKRGRFTKPVQLKRGAVWESQDPQAEAKLVNMDNGALQFFPEMARQFAGQIQNIMGGQTQAIQAGGKDGFGHTAPGEKRAQEFMDTSTNQITKILENFLRQYALVALDTLLSEQEGQTRLIVDDETKNKINQLKPGTVGDDNKIGMDWDTFYRGELSDPNDPNSPRVGGIEEWSIEIEVSVSKDEMEQKKRADLQDMLVVLAQNAEELGPEAQQKVQEITDLLMQDITPEVKPIGVGPVAPPTPTPGPGQSATGSGQVHETADLVKLFTSSADPNLRNAILQAMDLPSESPAALAQTLATPPASPPSKAPVKA